MDSELEKRISEHIEGCERFIRPSNNPIINQRMMEKIVVFRSAPRDVPSLERAIQMKKRKLKEAIIITQTDKLVNELEAPERIMDFIGLKSKARKLD